MKFSRLACLFLILSGCSNPFTLAPAQSLSPPTTTAPQAVGRTVFLPEHAPIVRQLPRSTAPIKGQPYARIDGIDPNVPAPGIVILNSRQALHDIGDIYWVVGNNQVKSMEGKNGDFALFYMGTTPVSTDVVQLALGMDADGTVLVSEDRQTQPFGGSPNPNPNPNPNPPTPPTPNPPTPPTPPTPPAPVNPVLPDGRFKLAKTTYDLTMAVPTASRGLASKLATMFDQFATDIAAGKYPDKFTAGSAMATQYQAIVGSNGDWSNWRTGLLGAVNQLESSETIGGIADFGAAMGEVANGLKQVTQTR